MTKADDIQRLVERIEGATGPDREIDAEIAETIGWDVRYDRSDPNDREPYYQPVAERSWTAVPAYTASLDAAMTLVPSEFYMGRLHQWVADNFRWACDLARKDMTGGKRISAEDCATPALAIAAASLRARITERTDTPLSSITGDE